VNALEGIEFVGNLFLDFFVGCFCVWHDLLHRWFVASPPRRGLKFSIGHCKADCSVSTLAIILKGETNKQICGHPLRYFSVESFRAPSANRPCSAARRHHPRRATMLRCGVAFIRKCLMFVEGPKVPIERFNPASVPDQPNSWPGVSGLPRRFCAPTGLCRSWGTERVWCPFRAIRTE